MAVMQLALLVGCSLLDCGNPKVKNSTFHWESTPGSDAGSLTCPLVKISLISYASGRVGKCLILLHSELRISAGFFRTVFFLRARACPRPRLRKQQCLNRAVVNETVRGLGRVAR